MRANRHVDSQKSVERAIETVSSGIQGNLDLGSAKRNGIEGKDSIAAVVAVLT